MSILTVTLNPAIDQTVQVAHFRANAVNRGQSMQFDAGGKGVNVAAFLVDAGHKASATGFLGDQNDEIFTRFFAQKGIDDLFLRLPGNTRIGVKIVDSETQETTDINMPGLAPDSFALDRLRQNIRERANSYDWVVLTGRIPPGVPDTFYADVISDLRANTCNVALDTSGAALIAGVGAGPALIKPNIDELEQLVGRVLPDQAAVIEAARDLLKQGAALVVVSMGEKGALFVSGDEALNATPPQITVASTVGAGDAMVAGILAAQQRNLSLADCARLATAFSVGTITQVGPHLPDAETVQTYASQVQVAPAH